MEVQIKRIMFKKEDKNTKFFHNMAKACKRNYISNTRVDELWHPKDSKSKERVFSSCTSLLSKLAW